MRFIVLQLVFCSFYIMSANDNKKMPGTGLEDIGVPGQLFLRDALTSCTDPLKAIEEFQVNILLTSSYSSS